MTWIASLILVLAPLLILLEIVNRRRAREGAREVEQIVSNFSRSIAEIRAGDESDDKPDVE